MGEKVGLTARVYSRPLIVEIGGLPPSVNHTYGYGRYGVYKNRDAVKWQNWASFIIKTAARESWGTCDLGVFKGLPIKLTISFIKPSWRVKSGPRKGKLVKPDVSNLVKIVEDALCSSLGLDDAAVVEMTALKIERTCHPDARTEVRMEFVREDGN